MMSICQSYRHHDMSGTDVSPLAERLLNPELFQFHLAAFLGLLLPFSSFLILLLVRHACAAMFKLNLRTHGPSLPEVVTHIDYGMGNIKLPMTRVVPMLIRQVVPAGVVTIVVT